MFTLTDKIALVTGSSRGIGAAIAKALAQQGATVIINHRHSQAEAEAIATAITTAGGKATVLQADVSRSEEAGQLIKRVVDIYGQINILVNNAGITRDNLIMKMKEEDWDLVLQTNLSSAYHCSKAAIRPMMKQRGGRIINLTSVVGLVGQAGQTNYAASKAGLIGFTKSLAKEVGSRNITVNAVAPGFITTGMTDGLPEELKTDLIKNTPLARFGTVEDVAHTVLFLASDEASFITGQVVSVNGGLMM
jgi:3-oxoacyl-[acyl-carrier protein] reductase